MRIENTNCIKWIFYVRDKNFKIENYKTQNIDIRNKKFYTQEKEDTMIFYFEGIPIAEMLKRDYIERISEFFIYNTYEDTTYEMAGKIYLRYCKDAKKYLLEQLDKIKNNFESTQNTLYYCGKTDIEKLNNEVKYMYEKAEEYSKKIVIVTEEYKL